MYLITAQLKHQQWVPRQQIGAKAQVLVSEASGPHRVQASGPTIHPCALHFRQAPLCVHCLLLFAHVMTST